MGRGGVEWSGERMRKPGRLGVYAHERRVRARRKGKKLLAMEFALFV